MLTAMKVAGSSPCDAEGASGQLNNVETAERPPGLLLQNPHRMRGVQEASRLLATVRRPVTRRDVCPDRFRAISVPCSRELYDAPQMRRADPVERVIKSAVAGP